jgi:hypothetical protein
VRATMLDLFYLFVAALVLLAFWGLTKACERL